MLHDSRIQPWAPLVLCPAYGMAAFYVTKGADGHLLAFFALFAALGVVYCLLLAVTAETYGWLLLARDVVLFECAACLGAALHPSLDEMAGALYLFIPLAVGMNASVAAVVLLVARRFASRRNGTTPKTTGRAAAGD